VTHVYIVCSSYVYISTAAAFCQRRDMGWLRWVGCLKIQVSLQNTGLFCRALLQKRPIFLSILLIVATPYYVLRHLFAKLLLLISYELRTIWATNYVSYELRTIWATHCAIYLRNCCFWFRLMLLRASWRKKGYWIPTRTGNSGRLHCYYWEGAHLLWGGFG